MDVASRAVLDAGGVGLFVYGALNRLLIVTGLHHILNNIAWFLLGDYGGVTGDLKRFFAGDPTAGRFMAGFFPVMMFGLPGACLAMYVTARPERRRAVGGLLLSMALTSFLTGVTEPIEFAFMFLAPVLYAVHAVLTGVAMVLMHWLEVRLGFGFSAGSVRLRAQLPARRAAAVAAAGRRRVFRCVLRAVSLGDPALRPAHAWPRAARRARRTTSARRRRRSRVGATRRARLRAGARRRGEPAFGRRVHDAAAARGRRPGRGSTRRRCGDSAHTASCGRRPRRCRSCWARSRTRSPSRSVDTSGARAPTIRPPLLRRCPLAPR